MPLVLAIEPDRRQASQLANLIRTRVGAELVLTDTTAQALDAIGNRVPDLVLVPALLAPQDDSAIAGALRVIAAAAHVQMLTIPVLSGASSKTQTPKRGVLARLTGARGEKPAAAGCDPAVFGEQIKAYLAEAAAKNAAMEAELEDRAEAAPPLLVEAPISDAPTVDMPMVEASTIVASPVVDSPIVETPIVVEAPSIVEAPVVDRPIVEVPLIVVEAPTVESPIVMEAPIVETAIAAIAIDEAPVTAAPETVTVDEDAHWLDMPIASVEETIAAFGEESLWSDEPVGLAPSGAGSQEVVASLPSFLRDLGELEAAFVAEDAPVLEHAVEEERAAFQADEPADLSELWMPLTVAASLTAPVLEGAIAESVDVPAPVVVEPVVVEAAVVAAPVAAKPVAMEAPAAAPAKTPAPTPKAEWLDLIESLRQDVERLRVERAQRPAPAPVAPRREPEGHRAAASVKATAKAEPVAKAAAPVKAAAKAEPVAKAAPAGGRAAKPKPPKAARPVQDEWGFFDPEQCGFAALLSKLQEITTPDDMNAQ